MKSIASRRECRKERRFIRRVGHHENDVNNGLGWQTRYGRRTHVLDSQRLLREDSSYPGGLPLEQVRPSRIVIDKQNASVQRVYFSNMGGANLFVGQGRVAVIQL